MMIPSPKKAFSLTEVMAAIVLITIALFGLISIQAHTSRSQNFNRKRHFAMTLAASRLAETEAKLEDDFTLDVAQVLAPDPEFPDFSVEISATEEASSPNLKKIVTRVVWKEQQGRLNYKLENIVARPE